VDVEEMQDAAAGFDEGMGAFAGKIFGDWNPGIVIVNSLASGDPIANMQRVGHWMTGAGMAGVALVNRLSSLTGSGKTIGADDGGKSGFSFVGKMVDKLSGGMLESALTLAPYILMALIFCGVTLAYYLPSVPYVLWTMGIISWVILVIETVVAAPIWAAGHAVPEGEGMAGQHGRQGYLLFLGVLMRPALMVIGFFAAYVVIAVVGHFIGATFAVFMAGLMQDSGIFEGMAIGAIGGGLAGAAGGGLVGAGLGAAGTAVGMSLLAVLATVFLGGGTLIIAVHKAFNLITWLPDNIMRWIGSGMPGLGEQGDEGRIKQIFVAGMGKVEGIATPAARGAHQSMKKMAGDKDADHALAQKGVRKDQYGEYKNSEEDGPTR
jgi:hypothetical protein